MKKMIALSIALLFSMSYKTYPNVKREMEIRCDNGQCETFTKLTVPYGQTLAATQEEVSAGQGVTLAAHCNGDAPFTVVWPDGMIQRTGGLLVRRSFILQETTTFTVTIVDALGQKTISNEVTVRVGSTDENIVQDTVSGAIEGPTDSDIEALLNEQHFAEQFESLSPAEKAALKEEPSYVSIWFQEAIASLFETFPLEDNLLYLVEKYPFLLDWYATFCEYTSSQPETLDIDYEIEANQDDQKTEL